MTVAQVRRREKTVTRRIGWGSAKPGDVVQPIVKGQGLKKGEHVEKLGGPIRFRHVSREHLDRLQDDPRYGEDECRREGCPHLAPEEFVALFARTHDCTAHALVTRIEFDYVGPAIESQPGGRT